MSKTVKLHLTLTDYVSIGRGHFDYINNWIAYLLTSLRAVEVHGLVENENKIIQMNGLS